MTFFINSRTEKIERIHSLKEWRKREREKDLNQDTLNLKL